MGKTALPACKDAKMLELVHLELPGFAAAPQPKQFIARCQSIHYLFYELLDLQVRPMRRAAAVCQAGWLGCARGACMVRACRMSHVYSCCH